MKKLSFYFVFSCCLVLTACNKDEKADENPQPKDNYDREALFTSLSNDVILPAFLDFVDEAEELHQKAHDYQDSPSLTALDSLQAAWFRAKFASKRIEQLKFGPLNETKMYSLVDKWPTNNDFIEEFIAGTDAFTASYINGKGATSKGLPAIEYLIFSETGDDSVHEAMQSDLRRIQYVSACTENLYQKTQEIASLWSPLGENYIDLYSTNTQSGLEGSLSLTVNQMSTHIEYMMVTKLGKPLGKDFDDMVNPLKLEAWRSKKSKDCLVQNLQIFNDLMSGKNGPGFADYLDYLEAKKDGQDLSEAILQQTEKVITDLEAINGSIYETIQSDPNSIDIVYNDLKDLLVLIKVDMTSALSVTLTFSDNDGD